LKFSEPSCKSCIYAPSTDAANHAIYGPRAFHREAMASQAAY